MSFFEKHAHFGSRAVHVVCESFHDYRHFVRGITLEDEMLQGELLIADSSAFFDGAFDGIACHRGFAGLFDSGIQAGIALDVRPAEFRGDHHFFHQFANDLAFFQICDFSLGVEPLSSHRCKKLNPRCEVRQL